jgi:hypothetical protein
MKEAFSGIVQQWRQQHICVVKVIKPVKFYFMKKMIVTLVVVMSLIGGKAFAAGEENVTRRAKETFKKEFPTAAFAKWEEIGSSDVYAVRFVFEEQGFIAYINARGSMIASARLTRFCFMLRERTSWICGL